MARKKPKKRLIEASKPHAPNMTILAFTIAMVTFGAIMIFDSSIYIANNPPFNDQFHFLRLHLIWLLIGVIPASLIYFWDYRKFVKLAFPALIVVIVMLVAVLLQPGDANGSKRWLQIGFEQLVVQPAELLKPVFILFLAGWLAKERKQYKSFNEAFRYGFGQKLIGFAVLLGTVLALVLLEPDLGTTMIICATAFIIFYVSGTDSAHIVGSGIVSGVLVLLAAAAAVLAPYRLERVKTYFHLLLTGEVKDSSDTGYQVMQILIGIGSAGFWGKGFGQSRQRFAYLVENTAFTDSIFAVILEELGMLGGILLILSWILFLAAGFKIAEAAPDRTGKLLAIGITVWLTLQALLNMAANVGLIPLTGIPLPFVTYGGSGTIVALIGSAILLNISRFTVEKKSNAII
ncbi:MAG: putative peptidoglycan glycosyltransferase FtsW [Candidatus Dojkabacteria bacterium]|nr:MAG: putative peptidoglycan glycosyltransferase FtsW [Candidatus Dojkabacteria bacterium]